MWNRSRAIRGSLLTLAIIAGFGSARADDAFTSAETLLLKAKRMAPDYAAYRSTLFWGLKANDFSAIYASDKDRVALRKAFAFLENEPTRLQKVLTLIAWLNENIQAKEVYSVRALEIYEKRAAACEVHALAIGVLEVFDIKARWICSVKSSMGFGYLEAYVEGGWQLFRLRSKTPVVGKSAWQLYKESEPSLSIRSFHYKPKQSVHSYGGTVYPGILPFGNVEIHPQLKTVFTTDKGLGELEASSFNPYDYYYGYWGRADNEWVKEGSVVDKFSWSHRQSRHWRKRMLAKIANAAGMAPITPKSERTTESER